VMLFAFRPLCCTGMDAKIETKTLLILQYVRGHS